MSDSKKEFATMLAATVAVLIFAGAMSRMAKQRAPVQEVNWKILECDPEHFANVEVALKTDGFQVSEDRKSLFYTRVAGQPPVVVCQMRSPTEEAPQKIRGICIGRQNGIVYVVDCRPVP